MVKGKVAGLCGGSSSSADFGVIRKLFTAPLIGRASMENMYLINFMQNLDFSKYVVRSLSGHRLA